MSIARTLLALGALSALPFAQAQTTVAGFTPGSYRVTESGAAEYRIPIRVPPGIAGTEPKLALVYNSQAGNGLLGIGWSLEGLSAITRCPRTVAQDGTRGAVSYDANDRFCLDGQRLMLIAGSPYGAAGSEYRTERDSFSKITASATTIAYPSPLSGVMPESFVVKTKAGHTMEYGATSDSRIEIQDPTKPTVRIWALSKVSDSKGNYFTATYTEDRPNGDFYPSRIDYSGNGGTGGATFASVRFVYETRPDKPPFYVAGSMIKSMQRLKSVQTYSGATLVFEYQLTYGASPSTQLSRLVSLTSCSSGVCLPATSFAWQDPDSVEFQPYVYSALASTDWSGWTSETGDFNGDGRTDLMTYYVGTAGWQVYVALSNGDGTFAPYVHATIASTDWSGGWTFGTGDFNGDGRTDLMTYYVGTAGWQVYVALSNGDGTFAPYVHATIASTNWSGWTFKTGDFNGDGRTDLMTYYVGTSGWGAYIALSNEDGTFAPYVPSWIANTDWSGWTFETGDFNGDGRTDVMTYYVGTSGWGAYIALSNGDGTFAPYVSSWIANTNWSGWTFKTGDFNGDGRTDLMTYYVGTSGWGAYIALSKGDGTFAPYVQSWIASTDWSGWTFETGDFNGDGRTDLMTYYAGTSGWGAYIALSNGDGTFAPYVPSWIANTNWSGWTFGTGDFNGDGRTDLMTYNIGTPGWRAYIASTPARNFAVTQLTGGLSATTAISYSSLASAAQTYTKDNTAVYPTIDLQLPQYVVSEVQVSNGVSGTHLSTYRYGGAKSNAQGRGFLGFRWHEFNDEPTGLKLRTEFRQDHPYIGFPSLVRKTQSTGTILSELNYTYSCINPASGAACTVAVGNRYFPYVSQSVETANDLNGAVLPTVTTTTQYDSYGNATSVAVSTGDGHSKTTSSIYVNDTTNWLLGRLKNSTVTSTVP
jgi:hypothetical protein